MNEAEVNRDPLIGVVVQNYVVQKQLAAGGMGAVYLATHERSGAKKAIKILLPHFANVPVIRARFEDEARGVMGVSSPYIVGIDNYGALPDGQLYLIMDFLDGETLEAHIARRGLSTKADPILSKPYRDLARAGREDQARGHAKASESAGDRSSRA